MSYTNDPVAGQLYKDVLISQIKLHLHLQGLKFNKKPTRRQSVQYLREQRDWLRRRREFLLRKKAAA